MAAVSHTDKSLGHDDHGGLVPTVDFDFAKVDSNLSGIEPESDLAEISPEQIEAAVKALRVMLQWVWQSGMKNSDGVKIRAIIVCWIFLKELRSLSLTDMANGYGLEKQSLGRWVDDFKKKFPGLRISHMR